MQQPIQKNPQRQMGHQQQQQYSYCNQHYNQQQQQQPERDPLFVSPNMYGMPAGSYLDGRFPTQNQVQHHSSMNTGQGMSARMPPANSLHMTSQVFFGGKEQGHPLTLMTDVRLAVDCPCLAVDCPFLLLIALFLLLIALVLLLIAFTHQNVCNALDGRSIDACLVAPANSRKMGHVCEVHVLSRERDARTEHPCFCCAQAASLTSACGPSFFFLCMTRIHATGRGTKAQGY
jgi:hypothetical protein